MAYASSILSYVYSYGGSPDNDFLCIPVGFFSLNITKQRNLKGSYGKEK